VLGLVSSIAEAGTRFPPGKENTMTTEETGTHPVRRAVVAGLIALVLGGSDALAARNCVSNAGKGRSARVKSLKVVGLTSDGRLLCFPAKSADKAEVVGSASTSGPRTASSTASGTAAGSTPSTRRRRRSPS
jgi:hypothetical protein